MADLDLLKLDVQGIMNLFRDAYYNAYGETMRIGSVEFQTASIFSYAVAVLINSMNDASKQRWLATATGEYLDAIAETYGLVRPDGYHATVEVRVVARNQGDMMTIPEGKIVISDQDGKYKFANAFEFQMSDTAYTVFRAVDAGSEYNGIPEGKLDTIVSGTAYITSCSNNTETSGGTDPMTDDEVFRAWLKNEIRTLAGAGTYLAYEARAKNADSRIVDVHVVQQGEDGYEKGKVQIIVLPLYDAFDWDSIRAIVQNACADPSFRPVGDFVQTRIAETQNFDCPYICKVSYPARFEPLANERNNRIKDEYNEYLRQKIGRAFSYADFCARLCEKDADGVYALDAAFYSTDAEYVFNPLPYKPASDAVLFVQTLVFECVYDRNEA